MMPNSTAIRIKIPYKREEVDWLPELPEVETIRRTLKQLVLHKRIESVDVTWPKMIKKPQEVEQFVRCITRSNHCRY